MIFSERMRQATINQTNNGTILKETLGKLLRNRMECFSSTYLEMNYNVIIFIGKSYN